MDAGFSCGSIQGQLAIIESGWQCIHRGNPQLQFLTTEPLTCLLVLRKRLVSWELKALASWWTSCLLKWKRQEAVLGD